MPTINDYKWAALKTLTGETVGTVKDLEQQWLQTETSSTGTTGELYLQWCDDNGVTSGTVNDRLHTLMGNEGYTGTLMDRLLQFWTAGGTLGGIAASFLLLESGDALLLESGDNLILE